MLGVFVILVKQAKLKAYSSKRNNGGRQISMMADEDAQLILSDSVKNDQFGILAQRSMKCHRTLLHLNQQTSFTL